MALTSLYPAKSMQDKSIDIIYCFRSRDVERIKRSLDSLTLQSDQRFKVIFIDYGSDEARSAEVKKLCANYSFCTYLFIDTRGQLWNRADALNYGFYHSKSDYVFTSDIDMVFFDTFVSFLHKAAEPETAKFFAVGYLSEQATSNLDLKNLASVSYVKSESFALGMVLASKALVTKVNGYNAFYALWGTEDNDLHYRIEQAGYKTEFIRDILMLHQYHAPSSTDSSVLPEGWLQFQKDYHEHFKISKASFKGLDTVTSTVSRPAKELYFDPATSFAEIRFRRLFIRYLLISDLLALSSGEGKAYRFHQDELNSGTFFKFKTQLNSLFRNLKFPLVVQSSHQEQYVSTHHVRDEIYFVLKSLEHYIKDYYLDTGEKELKLVIVKK